MMLRPFVFLILVLAAVRPAAAQFAQPQQPPCMKDFSVLRDEAEKRAKAVKAASERRASPQEACSLFKSLTASQAKIVKFVEDNATWCGIPPNVLTDVKTGYKHTTDVQHRVCQAALRPAAPAGPSLSDSLGTTRVPNVNNVKTGRGTYDTLTGTPLGNSVK